MADDQLLLDIRDGGTTSTPPTQPIEVITEAKKLPSEKGTRPELSQSSKRASQIVSGPPYRGNGLVGMRERAASLGG